MLHQPLSPPAGSLTSKCVCCTFGESSRLPVQLKQVQKLQPGDSEDDGEGKHGKAMAHLLSGRSRG